MNMISFKIRGPERSKSNKNKRKTGFSSATISYNGKVISAIKVRVLVAADKG